MGIFDSLFGKKKDEGADQAAQPAQPAETNWARRLKGYWDMDDPAKWPLCEELLGDIAPHLDSGKIKKIPDDDEIELRGRIGGTPVKINFEVDMGWVRPEMKITNRIGEIQLERDHEKIPQERDEDDDWASDDELRVFVAKGIFVEGDDEEVDETLDTLSQLPEALRGKLLAEIERLQFNHLYVYRDGMNVGLKPNNYEMADPVQHILDVVSIMKQLADTVAAGDRDMASEPRVIIRGNVMIDGQPVAPTEGVHTPRSFGRATCKYCSTLFVPGVGSRCPNCGAPLTG